MTVQDVTTLPTFNPHGGPITHRSTGSKLDSLVHPWFWSILCTWVRMWFTSWMLYHCSSWNQTPCYSCGSSPHSSFCLVIEWLPTRLKLWYHRILHSTNSLKYNWWGTLCISHWVHRQMPSFVEMCSSGVFPLVAVVGRWRSRRKDDDLIMVTWSREMKTSMKGINLIERTAKTEKTR